MCRFFVYAVHISTFPLLFLSLVDDAWMFSSSLSSEDEGTESPILGMYILNTMKSGVKQIFLLKSEFANLFQTVFTL